MPTFPYGSLKEILFVGLFVFEEVAELYCVLRGGEILCCDKGKIRVPSLRNRSECGILLAMSLFDYNGGKQMKKVITALWCVFGICILIFIGSVFLVKTDVALWRIFSFTMPLAGIAFWGAILLSVIEYIRSKKEK